jgi:hypothetical protein
MSHSRAKVSECAFCGATENVTDDHVPPKCLFAKPKPSNLITVPSCRNCNAGSGQDDTYFRDTLIFWDATRDHPVSQKLLPTVIGSLRRPEQEAYTCGIVGRLRRVSGYTTGGIRLQNQEALQFDPSRLNRTAVKIVKGLHYHEFGKRLSDRCSALAFCLHSEKDARLDSIAQKACGVAMSGHKKVIGNGVFTYWYSHEPEKHSERTVWLLLFYERVPFFGLTGPKDELG